MKRKERKRKRKRKREKGMCEEINGEVALYNV